jgi:hypothetical protein
MTDGSQSPALERLLAVAKDDAHALRYPPRTHFVDATNPSQAEIVTRELFRGDPVALIRPDGTEVLFTPETVRGVVAVLMILAGAWLILRGRRKEHDAPVYELPARTRVEVRDAAGTPIAA